MTYQTEFNTFDDTPTAEALKALGFEDVSWHNDICPHFLHPTARLSAWIDFLDAGEREFPESPRLTLYDADADGSPAELICATDDAAHFLDAIAACLRLESVADRMGG